MFQVSALLSELISDMFRALLETGCCTLRPDGDRMMPGLTCVSYLLLLSTVWPKCINEDVCSEFLLQDRSWYLTMSCTWKYIPPVAIVQLQWCRGSRRGSAVLGSREPCHKGSRYRSLCLEEQTETHCGPLCGPYRPPHSKNKRLKVHVFPVVRRYAAPCRTCV